MSEITQTGGYLDVVDATLRAPRLEATSNIGIANTNPEHAFSVGSKLYVSTDSSNVITVDGNVVCEGVKVGLIEIVPSYDLAAVSNVGNVTQSTIQFANATTGFVTTANATIGSTNTLFVNSVNNKVGIGKTEPTEALDVVGNVAVDTNTLFVDSVNNKVGIGTTTPNYKLHVRKNTDTLLLESENAGATYPVNIDFKNYDTQDPVGARISAIDDSAFGSHIAFYTKEQDGNDVTSAITEKVRIKSNGYVGIGTQLPGARLQVGDGLIPLAGTRDADGSISVYGTGQKKVDQAKPGIYHRENVGLGIHADYQMSFEVAGSSSLIEAMRILNDGKVGIGTDNPVGLLDIRAASKDPGAVPTVHIGDDEQDFGDYGMVNLVRHATSGGTKCHAAFIRNGNTVFGMGYYNNTNDFAFWKGFGNVSQSPAMIFQTTTGNVGINTTTPYAKLHVFGGAGAFNTTNPFNGLNDGKASYMLYNSATVFTNTTGGFGNISIYGSDDILSGAYIGSFGGYITASDSRIKKEIVDVEDGSALESLRLLKPKQYKYKDEVKRGSEPVWGFIAQEVRDTLPFATQLLTECLPNIYEMANVSDSNVITFTNFDTSDLESNAMVLKVFDKDDTEHLVNITEVVDDRSVRVEEDLSEWTGSVDESGNVVAGNQLFVYGQRVDDFVFLRKESIWTVATAALQEVDRQLQAEKAKVASLEARVLALESA